MENDAQNNNVLNDNARNNNMNEKEKMKRYGETKMKVLTSLVNYTFSCKDL